MRFRYPYAAAYLALFILLVWLVPVAGFPVDVGCWAQWATYSRQYGLGNSYAQPDLNYTPLYLYVLYVYGLLAGSAAAIQQHIHSLRAFTLLFDFAGALTAVSLVTGGRRRFALSLLLLLNVGYLYNTLLWEQVDAIYTFLSFMAVLLALRQQLLGSVLCYVLAIYFKLQAVIFLPPLLLLWLPLARAKPRQLGWSLLGGAGLQLLVLAPFIWFGDHNYLPRILAVVDGASSFLPFLSNNAFNLWYLLFPGPSQTGSSDALLFLHVSYKHWGLLLFAAGSALVLWPLLRLLVRYRRPLTPAHAVLVLLTCGLLPIVFCYFNTQMHERYWHAAVLFLAAYGFLTRDYWPYGLFSVAYLLNLETQLGATGKVYYVWIPFWPQLVALLFTAVLVLGLQRLYRLAAIPQTSAMEDGQAPSLAPTVT